MGIMAGFASSWMFTSALGVVVILYSLFRFCAFVYGFLRRGDLARYQHSSAWVLVTGASDGIGYGFADVFLERGFNVLLHGRNAVKLARIRDELSQRRAGRAIDIVVADAGRYDDAYLKVAQKAISLPGKLTVLVNNVGGQTLTPQYVSHWDMSHEDIDMTMNLNARFPTHLTRALLPELRKNGKSLILNCGSVGGLLGVPYLVTYTACKSYVHTFSSAIKNELLADGNQDVEVMGFVIGNVTSATNTADMPLFTISARECARGCLNRVGSGSVLAWAHWRHALQVSLTLALPEFAWRKIMAREMEKRVQEERAATRKQS